MKSDPMCNICEKVRSNPTYSGFISKMLDEDLACIAASKSFVSEFPSLSSSIYSSVKWPIKLLYPLFEPRIAYCAPNNYFQSIQVAGERWGGIFSHGSTRAVFFADDKLMLLSKTVSHTQEKDFFASFLLADFDKTEFKFDFEGENRDNLKITVNTEKNMTNLVTGKQETKKIAFGFVNQSVKNHIISREKVLSSTKFASVYNSYGGATKRAASIDLEGYAVTVPHFSPHPYLLQVGKDLGHGSNRQFLEHTMDYFKSHLLR